MTDALNKQYTLIVRFSQLCLFEGVITIAFMLTIPSDPKNQYFLALSIGRLVLLTCVLVLIISQIAILILLKFQRYYRHIISLLGSSTIFYISSLICIVTFSGVCFLWVFQDTSAYFLRLIPLFFYCSLLFLQISILHLLLISNIEKKDFFSLLHSKVNEIFYVLKKPGLILSIIILICFPILFLNAFKYNLPLGYAGLFTLMAEEIADLNFKLPNVVPFYGPGNIPFAYPPLGIYLMASLIRFNLDVFYYLRFFPPLFSLLALIPLFFLSWEISESKIAATLSAIILASSPLLYVPHTWSAGVVRALAFGLILTALYFYVRAVKLFEWKDAVLSGIFFGLATLTHLSYTIFFLVWILAWLLTHPNQKSLFISVLVLLVGSILVLPWMIVILTRYGFSVFDGAFHSHGNASFLSIWSGNSNILSWIQINLNNIISDRIFTVLVIFGIGYLLMKRLYALPAVFILVTILISEQDRFLIVIGGLIIGIFIAGIVRHITSHDVTNSKKFLLTSFGTLIIVGISSYFYINGFWKIIQYQPKINDHTLNVAEYIRENSKMDERYLVVTRQDEAEWFPYLLKREPIIAQWGSEWLGTYNQQTNYMAQIRNCRSEQDLDCLQQVMTRIGSLPEYIITLKSDRHLTDSLSSSLKWEEVFQNSRYLVWQYED